MLCQRCHQLPVEPISVRNRLTESEFYGCASCLEPFHLAITILEASCFLRKLGINLDQLIVGTKEYDELVQAAHCILKRTWDPISSPPET